MLSNRDWVGRVVFWNVFNNNNIPYDIMAGKIIRDLDDKGCYTIITEDGNKKQMPWHCLFGSKLAAITDALRIQKETNIPHANEIFQEAVNRLKLLSYLTDDLNAIGFSFRCLGKDHSL